MTSKEKIYAIGLWTLRVTMAVGAIVCGLCNKAELTALLALAIVWSFLLA